MKPPKFTHCIIDLDIPIYKAAAIGQKTHYTLYNESKEVEAEFTSSRLMKEYIKEREDFLGIDTSEWTHTTEVRYKDVEECYKILDNTIKTCFKITKTKQALFSIDGEGNFRDSVAVTKVYKGNRTGERPIYLQQVKEYAKKKYSPVIANGIESDDQISIWLYKDYLKAGGDPSKCKLIMVDFEKDCRTTCGWHIDYYKDDSPVWVSELEANRWLFTQTLAGDSCDNYAGCSKIGMVKAKQALEDATSTQEIIKSAAGLYIERHPENARELLTENLRLAMMLREGDPEEDWKVFLPYIEEAFTND